MKNYLIAERYARALNETITDNTHLEEVGAALRVFSDLFEENHDIRSILGNAVIDAAVREKVLDDVLTREGSPKVVKRLLHVLLERGRIALLPDVAVLFERFVDQRLNRVSAKVTTAGPLSEQQKSRILEGLEQYSGKTIRLECQVDPAVIGGVVAEIEGKVIDGSLHTQLERMKEALLAEE